MCRNLPANVRRMAMAIALGGAISGCTEREVPEVVPIQGTVLLDGAPLKFGTVTFQPTRGQPARGEITADGEFRLSTYRLGDGAAVGRHKVKVACYTSQDPAVKNEQGGKSESLGASLIPERYTRFDTSGLEVAVLSGGNKPFVLELSSEPDAEPPAGESSADESTADDEAAPAAAPAPEVSPERDEPGSTGSAPSVHGNVD